MKGLSKSRIPYLIHHWPIVTGCIPEFPCWVTCWARRMAARFHKSFEPQFHESILTAPSTLRRPSIIGVAFGGDIALMGVIGIARVMEAIRDTPHQYVFLTKRIEAIRGYFSTKEVQPKAFIGFTISSQHWLYDFKSDIIAIQNRGWPIWLSVEPMLGPVTLNKVIPFIAGVIAGGESGPRSYPLGLDLVRALRDECLEAGIPFAYKQGPGDGVEIGFCGEGAQREVMWLGKKVRVPVLDGQTHTALAWDHYHCESKNEVSK